MPITCQYIALYGKWDLADVVQLRQLRCGDYYPGLSDEVHCNHKGLCKGMDQRRTTRVRVGDMTITAEIRVM